MTLDELEAEAKKLDPTSRAALISRLSASLAALQNTPGGLATAAPGASPPPTEEQKEREWLQEALRRSRELRERQIQTEPPDRRPTAASASPPDTEPGPAPTPTQRAAVASRPTPGSGTAPKKRKAAPSKRARRTAATKAKSKPRRPARPVAKKRAASRPKPKAKPKAKSKLSKSQVQKKR